MRTLVVAALIGASCSYDVTFHDCQVTCSTGCPDGFSCGAEGLCRASGATGTCAAILDANGDSNPGNAIPGVYVTDFNGNAVVIFGLDNTGTPRRTITGSTTGLATPVGIAVDHAGEILVANLGGVVTVYARDADGDVAPVRTLMDPALSRPLAVAVAADDGVFVATQDAAPQVFHFPPGASASDRHFTTLAGTNTDPYLALTEAGDVVVADTNEVGTYAGSATGFPTALHTFTPSQAGVSRATAVAGAIAVTADTGEILLFDEQSSGSGVAPTSTLAPPEIVHGVGEPSLAVDTSSGSPVFYTSETQNHDLFVVPTTGSGASLTAGTVVTIPGPIALRPAGIAVVP